MRRIMIVVTALAVLAVATGVAYAATFNSYTSTFKFATTKAGSKKKPVPMGYTEMFKVKPLSTQRAAPVIDIKTTVYGLISTAKANKLPTCTSSQIMSNPVKFDKVCPPKSRVASGFVKALLGPSSLQGAGTMCDLDLHVYNGGHNTVVFFLVVPTPTSCGGLSTGRAAPWTATFSQHGKNLVLNIKLPPDVSTRAANISNLYASLIQQKLVWKPDASASVACKAGKRPWSIQFTAVKNGVKETPQTVKGSGKCSPSPSGKGSSKSSGKGSSKSPLKGFY